LIAVNEDRRKIIAWVSMGIVKAVNIALRRFSGVNDKYFS